jgi:hypothetical protein
MNSIAWRVWAAVGAEAPPRDATVVAVTGGGLEILTASSVRRVIPWRVDTVAEAEENLVAANLWRAEANE